jgi:hypothetical protein
MVIERLSAATETIITLYFSAPTSGPCPFARDSNLKCSSRVYIFPGKKIPEKQERDKKNMNSRNFPGFPGNSRLNREFPGTNREYSRECNEKLLITVTKFAITLYVFVHTAGNHSLAKEPNLRRRFFALKGKRFTN